MSHSLFQRFGTNRYQTQYDELQKKHTELQKTSDEKTRHINRLNNKITDLETECKKKDDMIAILDARIQNYLTDIKKLRDDACEQNTENCSLKDKNATLKTQLEEVTLDRDTLIIKLQTQADSLSGMTEKYKTLETNYSQQLTKNGEIERQLLQKGLDASHCMTLLSSVSEELQLIKRKFDIRE
jgi:chromosome segregation ATPase